MQSTYIDIKTAQNVTIQSKVTDPRIRILAKLLDVLVFTVWIITTSFIKVFLSYLGYVPSSEDVEKYFSIMLPAILYAPIMSSINGGQTFGKKIMQIKVVKKNGGKAHFGHYLARTVLFFFDIYLVGLLLMVFTKYKQRLGDLIAGTVVVEALSQSPTTSSKDTSYTPMFDKVNLLSMEDARVIKEIIDPNNISNPEQVDKTVEKLKAILQVPDTLLDGVPFLRQVIKDYDYHRQS